MKIIIKDKSLKINDFVNYLVENHSKKNKSYKFQITCDDKYDRRLIHDKESLLKNKLLVLHSDGFSVFDPDLFNHLDDLKEKLEDLSGSEDIIKEISSGKVDKQLVHYQLTINDGNDEWDFSFQFLNILKEDSK